MKLLFVILIVIVIILSYIRLSKVNQSIWHIDPELINKPDLRKSFLYNSMSENDGLYFLNVFELHSHLNEIIHKDGCKQIFGGISTGIITYVCRSKIFGFPDYISISFKSHDDGKSSLFIFSRSRFGVYDFGKNKDRIKKWLTNLESTIQKS